MNSHDSQSAPESTVEVVRADDSGRYELHVDGQLAGIAEFLDDGERTVFTHTEVDDAFQGQGLGSTLVEGAVTDAVSRNRTIVPQCPYTARWLDRHEVPGARVESP